MSRRKPWRMLFVGVGSIGERHLRCFLKTNRVTAAICERDEKRCHEVADRYGISHRYSSLETAPLDSFDVALVATPAHLHIPQAIVLAEAGVHLFLEKPLSTSLERIEELRHLIESGELTAAVAYFYRTHPALVAMKNAIDEGRFGRPVQLISINGQNLPHYRPAYRDVYYRDRAMGGGAIQDILTHSLNAGEWLAGPIDRVAVDAAHMVLEGVEVEDVVHVCARHGDVMATYSVNQFQMPNEVTLTVNCEKGSACFDLLGQKWKWMDQVDGSWHEESFGPLERDELYLSQAGALLDVLHGHRPPPCSFEEGLQTLRVNLTALRLATRDASLTSVDGVESFIRPGDGEP